MKSNKISLNKKWVKEISIHDPELQVKKAIEELLSLPNPVNAILFTNNILSTLGLVYINSLTIKVPSDIAVVSFDESVASELFYAPVTHIRQPLKELGQKATNALLDMINTDKTVAITLKAELVIRKSTER